MSVLSIGGGGSTGGGKRIAANGMVAWSSPLSSFAAADNNNGSSADVCVLYHLEEGGTKETLPSCWTQRPSCFAA